VIDSNFLKVFWVNVKACFVTGLPNQYCPGKFEADFWVMLFCGPHLLLHDSYYEPLLWMINTCKTSFKIMCNTNLGEGAQNPKWHYKIQQSVYNSWNWWQHLLLEKGHQFNMRCTNKGVCLSRQEGELKWIGRDADRRILRIWHRRENVSYFIC